MTRSISIVLVLAACAAPAVPPASPVFLGPSPSSPPAVIDRAAFLALLEQKDWSATIDPAIGWVQLDDGDIRQRCGPRGATWAKYDALSLAAEIKSQPGAAAACSGFETGTIQCRWRTQRNFEFRFTRRGTQLVLDGIASYKPGTLTAATTQRYVAAIANRQRCPN